ncbi:MAG: transferrin-binding protein-like solute binding protein [Acidimicrobiaceae bacterium]|nr:transferrin-binding protein-like solute binding protein [Acidimicrobiaceae bacterium]
MQRADITPADLQALQDQVATLIQRADITPADLQALQAQLATLMQRADITPADLDYLWNRLDDALAELALLRAQMPNGVEIDPRIEADDPRYRYAANARAVTGGQDPTLSSDGHDQRVRQILTDADFVSMLYYWQPAGGNFAQVDPECSGVVCTFGDPADPPITRQNLVPPSSDITFFPVMQLNGIEIHESYSYGADDFGPWIADTSAAVLNHVVAMDQQRWWDSGEQSAARIVWGDSTGHDPLPGAATWSGALVGYGGKPDGQGNVAFTQVRGIVDMTVRFGGSTTLDVMFSDIKGLNQGEVFNVDPWMALPVNGGSFQDGTYLWDIQSPQRYVEGRFFGPNAEEAGGLFADNFVSDADAQISGAFAAARGNQ